MASHAKTLEATIEKLKEKVTEQADTIFAKESTIATLQRQKKNWKGKAIKAEKESDKKDEAMDDMRALMDEMDSESVELTKSKEHNRILKNQFIRLDEAKEAQKIAHTFEMKKMKEEVEAIIAAKDKVISNLQEQLDINENASNLLVEDTDERPRKIPRVNESKTQE